MFRSPWICRTCRANARALTPQRRTISTNSRFFRVSEEVQQAIAERRPVVALESTIYTHGFPYPDNMALASRLETLVRVNGGVPATVGVLNGISRVGMGADELMQLVSSAGQAGTLKVSRRDLGFVCGSRGADGKPLNGGTTVSATMILAHLAGIRVFATGGIGGVHRGAEHSMDVSADITELGRTPVAVVSSGCKSFLDIPKTLEYLETQGVAVTTFADGRVGPVDFPAFWSRDSGLESPATVADEAEAAKVIHAHMSLGLQSGLHFANPIPEQYSIPFEQMEVAIRQALKGAHTAGATGAASTPFILAKIKQLTGSKSMEANKALVEANVVRGTRVAVALSKLELGMDEGIKSVLPKKSLLDLAYGAGSIDNRHSSRVIGPAASNYATNGVSKGLKSGKSESKLPTTSQPTQTQLSVEQQTADIFVAGSLAIDLACDFAPRQGSALSASEMQTSNPAMITQSLGGVGHNVAHAAHLMGATVRLCSVIGDDLSGKAALEAVSESNMSGAGIKTMPHDSEHRTAQYVAIYDSKKDLVLAMADMAILEDSTRSGDIFEEFWLPQLRDCRPSHLVLDANWTPAALGRWLDAGRDIHTKVLFEPVSNVKGAGLFQIPKPFRMGVFPEPSVHIATPNVFELTAMYDAARKSGAFDRPEWWGVIDALGIPHSGARTQLALATSNALVDQGIPQQSIQLLPFIPSICTKLGPQGVLLTQLLPANDKRLTSGECAPYILSRCANGTEDTTGVGGVYMRLFPAVEKVKTEDVVSVNGVGDTFAGTLVAGLAKRGKDVRVEDLVDLAQRAAVLSLKSKESVSPGLGTLRILL